MSILDGHVAYAAESNYGTAGTTSRGLETNPQEWDFKDEYQVVESSVRRPGQTSPTTTFGKVFMGISGTGAGELRSKGHGLLLKQWLGGAAVITHPDEASMYRHTFTPDATAKYGQSLTLQLFKPFMDTLGLAVTGKGVKVLGLKLSCEAGGNVKYGLSFDGQAVATSGRTISSGTVDTDKTVTVASTVGLSEGMLVVGTGVPVGATIAAVNDATTFELSAAATATGTANLVYSQGATIAKASPTFPSGAEPFTWDRIAVTLDGQDAYCTGWEVGYEFTLATGRRFMSNGGLKKEPVVVDLAKGTLSLKGIEFLASSRQYDRYAARNAAGSLAAFVATCSTASNAAGTTPAQLRVSVPYARALQGPPDMKGMQVADFDILGSSPLEVRYDTLDSAP